MKKQEQEKNLRTILDYHERSKHAMDRYANALGYLDWANQPVPFRFYEGTTKVTLQQCDSLDGPLYDALFCESIQARPLNHTTLSRFFYFSMALSAWKKTPAGDTWPLRVNPSSGNLHPTEVYLLTDAHIESGPAAGLYHYNAFLHALELRRSVIPLCWQHFVKQFPADSFFIGISSVYWREAWKYGERAYRYCNHDVGHAIAALSLAAACQGWKVKLIDCLGDQELAALLGIENQQPEEAEQADCLLVVYPQQAISGEIRLETNQEMDWLAELQSLPLDGHANRLSKEHHPWPIIAKAVAATVKPASNSTECINHMPLPAISMAMDSSCDKTAFQIIRQRRSAVAMDGVTRMERSVFYRLLSRLQPDLNTLPFNSLNWKPAVSLALFVHRVDEIPAGLYLLVRDSAHEASLKQSLSDEFVWQKPQHCPDDLRLYLLVQQDVKQAAQAISCHQEIAAEGVFSLGMLAHYKETLANQGAHFYPRLYWECGAIGQLLYLEAEAVGLRGTGIGCFFDDVMHQVLGITDDSWQSLYHFTLGGPLEDERLQTEPAYKHLP